MTKNTAAAAPVETAGQPDELTLTEFCTRLSATVRRPELLAGFESTEKSTGRVKDTAEAFAERFNAFCKKPV